MPSLWKINLPAFMLVEPLPSQAIERYRYQITFAVFTIIIRGIVIGKNKITKIQKKIPWCCFPQSLHVSLLHILNLSNWL